MKILLPQLWLYFNNLLKYGLIQMEFAGSEGGGETKMHCAISHSLQPANLPFRFYSTPDNKLLSQ